jgi:O-antigen ligase
LILSLDRQLKDTRVASVFSWPRPGIDRPSLSYLYIMSVPYVAGLSSISGASVWGLQYTGFIWATVLVVGVLMVLQRRRPIPFSWRLWCPWYGYVLLSIIWGGIHWRDNLQDPAQMITPLIVGMVASYAIETKAQLESLMRGFIHCLLFVGAVFAFFWYGPGVPYQDYGRGYSVRTSAMTVAFIGCLFVARVRKNALRSSLGWAACLAITFLSGSRMATFVLLLLWFVTPLYRRFRSRLLVSGVMCTVGLALFYSPIFQQRFFPADEHGSLQQVMEGNFSGSGRFEEIWPAVWEGAQNHIVFGAGAGEVDRFVEKAQLSATSPLNDYLRVVFEYGVVGLMVLIFTVLGQMHVLHKLMRTEDPAVKWALTAAFLGFFTLLVFACTENALIYGVYFMHPLFAVTGAATGLNIRMGLVSCRSRHSRCHITEEPS